MSRIVNSNDIAKIAEALKGVEGKFVFTGGAMIRYYINDHAAMDLRPTDDLDIVIEVISYKEFTELGSRLLKVGFQIYTEAAIISRYKFKDISVDFIPTQNFLGFSNIWHTKGIEFIETIEINNSQSINIFSPPCFIASKIEAFKSRGSNDLRMSHDFEDIIYLIDSRKEIEYELINAPKELKDYLVNEFSVLLERRDIFEGIYSHLQPDTAEERAQIIINILHKMIQT